MDIVLINLYEEIGEKQFLLLASWGEGGGANSLLMHVALYILYIFWS